MSPTPRCKDCFQKAFGLKLGRCETCYEDLLNNIGELQALVGELGDKGPETYQYEEPDIVYANFYRLEDNDGFYVVKLDERQWCLRLDYRNGFPSPPRLAFVNSFNHLDDNPIWWPKTQFKLDPIKKTFDLPDIDWRSSSMLADNGNETPLHRWVPNYYVELIAPKILP